MAPSNTAVSCRQHVPRELNVKEEYAEKVSDFLTPIPHSHLHNLCIIKWFCLGGITYALINLIRTTMYEDKLALKCWWLSTPCTVLCACHMLINLFYLMYVYILTCTGNILFLLRDKTVKNLKRMLFCVRDTSILSLSYYSWFVCIDQLLQRVMFTLSNIPWSSHLLCVKWKGWSIWCCLQLLSAMLLSWNFSSMALPDLIILWGLSSLYFVFLDIFFLLFSFLLFVSLFLLIMSSLAKKINSLLLMVPPVWWTHQMPFLSCGRIHKWKMYFLIHQPEKRSRRGRNVLFFLGRPISLASDPRGLN